MKQSLAVLGVLGAAVFLAACTQTPTTPPNQTSATPTAASPALGSPVTGSPSARTPGQASPEAATVPLAVVRLERGHMIWRGDTRQIYVLRDDGTYQAYPDTFQAGEPESGGSPAPAGLQEPVRGFGKVWRENPAVREALGWAVAAEQGVEGTARDTAEDLVIDAQGLGQWVLRDNNRFEKTR